MVIFWGVDYLTGALLVFKIFYFFPRKNLLHCYGMKNGFSEGTAFLRCDSNPPLKGIKEDINVTAHTTAIHV